jgi:hypothetical protein
MKVAGTTLPEVSLSDISRAGVNYQRFHIKIEQPITLAPGATRIFSTSDTPPAINTAADNI